MNSLNLISLSELSDNSNVNISKEITVKILLSKLREKYSLKQIIDTIIAETTKPKNENNNINNDNNELNKIISLICNDIGTLKIYKYILDIVGKENKNTKLNKDEKNNININKNCSLSSKIEESFIEIDNDNDDDNYNNNNNIINLDEEDDDNDDNEEIINISDTDSDDITSEDNIMISLCENESTTYVEQKGRKTELKSNKKRIKKKSKKHISLNKHKSNTEQKYIKIKEKMLRKKIKNLSYHCSIINGEFYKYKLKSFNSKGIAKFICFNPKCEGYGTYNINNKNFTLLKGHNIENNECSFNIMDSPDKTFYSHMKDNDIDEMQIVNK